MVVIAWTRTILGDGAGSTVVTSRPDTYHGVIDGASLKLNDATNQIILDADATNKLTLTAPTLTAARTLTFPDATDTLVGKATTDTLTNKTLASPTITGTLSIATIGPDADSQHTLPNVADDTVVLLAATQTLSNKTLSGLTLSGATVSGAAPATPTANVLYTDSVPKGWISFDATTAGGTIRDDLNVSSITDNGLGDFTITWARAFANADYAVGGMAREVTAGRGTIVGINVTGGIAAASLRIEFFDDAATNVDPAVATVIAIGDN